MQKEAKTEKKSIDNEDAPKQPLVGKILDHVRKIQKELFRDQTGAFYYSYDDTDGNLVTLQVESAPFDGFVQNLTYNLFKRTLKTDALREIRQILTIEASSTTSSKPRHLYRRVGRKDNVLFYDLGSSTIKIDQEGWEVTQLQNQIFRFNNQVSLNQVYPIKRGDLDLFFENVNVKSEQDRLLIKLFIVAAFLPDMPHPILIIHGPKGSGKSGLLKMLLQVIDPSSLNDVSMKKEEDFFLFAANRWAIGIDNISRIRLDDSDILCKLSTGGAFQKRALYSNDTIVVMKLKNVVILNGIPFVAEKPDLIDRALICEMSEIEAENRQTEEEIISKFELSLPSILGGIFDILSKTLKLYPDIKPKKLLRMADFHRYSLAIGQVLGYSALQVENALKENQRVQIDMATESSWLAQLIIEYLTERLFYEGTATEFLKLLKDFNETGGNQYAMLHRLQPNRLMGELARLKQTLEFEGIRFDRHARSNDRVFSIKMDDKVRDQKRGKNSVGTVSIAGKGEIINREPTLNETFENSYKNLFEIDGTDNTDDDLMDFQ